MSETFDLLRIFHQTVYRYRREVKFLPHRLVLRPREGHDLRVESLALATIPRSDIAWSRDIFGNSIARAYFTEPGGELRIESDVVIRHVTHVFEPPPAAIEIPYPLQYDELEQPVVEAYLKPVYPAESETLQQWVRAQALPSSATAEELVLHLTAAIHKLVRYQRREEKGVQSPATTLTLGQGSCRDVASLLMECARHLGIATRFASGYLDCPATRAARGVTHAWTEVYFPGLGWRGYDPTTGQRCSQQHIVTGVSNHPRGVMPVSGKFQGAAADFEAMEVRVEFSIPATGNGMGVSAEGTEPVPA
jgi:transglutaminase-like putative cysteine protease